MTNEDYNVLFVCTGNTCRSPMAEHYLRDRLRKNGVENISVQSAGISAADGYPNAPEGKMALAAKGVESNSSQSQRLTRPLVDWADLILTMTHSHRRRLINAYPDAADKTETLLSQIDSPSDVADPVGGTLQDYIACLDVMIPALDNVLQQLQEKAQCK